MIKPQISAPSGERIPPPLSRKESQNLRFLIPRLFRWLIGWTVFPFEFFKGRGSI